MEVVGRPPSVADEQQPERDTPIFVGELTDIRAALDRLDGASVRVEA